MKHRARWMRSMAIGLSVFMIGLTGCQKQSNQPDSENKDQPVQVSDTQTGSFLNGPYLCGAKTDSMVVVWEAKMGGDAELTYQLHDGKGELQKMTIKETPGPEFNGEPMHMYYAYLEGLGVNTKYDYEVTLKDGSKLGGTFKTLPDSSDELTFVAISDSHKFETAEQFNAMVEEKQPDFILHTGDFIEGTGTQKDQFTFWFGAHHQFLHDFPVMYNVGNHDFGAYYDAYVTVPQKAVYKSDDTGHCVSYNIGSIHVAMMDSNLWGLFELNEEAEGKPASEKTHQAVVKALDWLKADLDSKEAKDASFRIVTMHHPYTDTYTYKYIPPIVEAGNVNLVLAGHEHLYRRFASENPEVGSNIMYITQGDARIGDGKVSNNTAEKKVSADKSNMIADGKGDYIFVSVKDNKFTLTNFGLKNGKEEEVETFTITSPPAPIEVSNVKIEPTELKCNGTIEISFNATNTGEGVSCARLVLEDNGEKHIINTFGKYDGAYQVELKPGETVSLKANYDIATSGKHTIKINDQTWDLTVSDREPTAVYKDLKYQMGSGEKNDLFADDLRIRSTAKNIGQSEGSFEAHLIVDNQSVDHQTVRLKSGEEKTIEFKYQIKEPGEHQIRIGQEKVPKDRHPADKNLLLQSPERSVLIQGTIKGMPMVKDQSGTGNHAYIHGNPRLVEWEKGRYGLTLDGEHDYLEIPDRDNYNITDGMTGIVWSQINGLSDLSAGEWDHNPLLCKGISVNYGTNYLMRMAVRTTGKLTYGVSFDEDNGEYFWNDDDADQFGAQLKQWTQYTATFDRASGGTAYQNGIQSGHLDPPDFNAEIRNWKGQPMFSGYTYCRHVLPNRLRGKRYTLLNGGVGEIRFYDARLTADENKKIFDHPADKGPQADHLKIWLQFKPDQFINEGSHLTEWFDAKSLKTLDYKASVPTGAQLKLVVQSDASQSGKDLQQFDLKDGQNQIDLSGISADGHQVRLKTIMVSKVDLQGTAIPSVESYLLKDGDVVTKSWRTLADFNKGTFEGACGYEDQDRFANHDDDFDQLK